MNKTQSTLESTQEEMRIKLLLEASLLRKVEIDSIKPINKNDKLRNQNLVKEDITYNVWLYSPDTLKEVVPNVVKNQEYIIKIY